MRQSSNIKITSDFGTSTEIVLGKEREINFYLSNTSDSEKAFNVSAELIISDGLDLSSSTPAYTKAVQDAGRRYTITSFKDFLPLESDVSLTYVMHSLNSFLNGVKVPFSKALTATVSITWDSMPRGSYDSDNEQYYNIYNFSMTTIKLSVTKSLPVKRVKGAGNADTAATKPFTCVSEIINNTSEAAVFTIDDFLPNGFRYLGGYSVLMETKNTLPAPTLVTDYKNNQQFLHWDTFTLEKSESIRFQYNAAIYDRYMLDGVPGAGEIISHNSALPGSVVLTTATDAPSANYTITAMDMVLSVSLDKHIVDCGDAAAYTLWVEANQYHNLTDVAVHTFTPDGQTPAAYGSGVVGVSNSSFQIPVDYVVSTVEKNTSQSLSLSTLVETNYRIDSGLVACGDIFLFSAEATGENKDTAQQLFDTASAKQSIVLPKITKVITGRYYRSLLPKNIPALAPLDYIEYELTYDSTLIQAAQSGIILDDFFPLDSSIPDVQSITVLKGEPVDPIPIDPHGLRWILGTVVTGTVWKIRCKSQISAVFTSNFTVNLFKLAGKNHIGSTYSQRANTQYQTGAPNIVVNRSLSGIDGNKVESGARYSAAITFTNQQNAALTTTDAFHFDALANIGGGVQIDLGSIQITGTGAWSTPAIDTEQVSIPISRLKVGEFVTIGYQAVIPNDIPPAYRALLSSQLEIPYSQPFSITENNVQYKMDAIMSSFSLKSAPLVLSQSVDAGAKQIGGTIDYAVTVTVPKGTAIFNSVLADTLPYQQSYAQIASVGGVPVTASYENHVITFPAQTYLYQADENLQMIYHMTANIDDADITSADVLQRNLCRFSFTDKDGLSLSASAYKDVTISNPLLKMSLSAVADSLSSATDTTLTLNLINVGKVNAAGVIVKADLPLDVQYISSSSNIGIPAYDAENRQVILSLPSVSASGSVTLSYVVKGGTAMRVGTRVSMAAQTGQYTNQLSTTRKYPVVSSNSYILTAFPGVFLSIYPPYRSQSGNGYVQVSASSTAIVPYTLVNKGGGLDSFRLSVSESKYPYEIQMDGVTVVQVAANSGYNSQPAPFANLTSGGMCTFRLIFAVPQVPLYDRNPYRVSVESLFDAAVHMYNETEMVDP